MDDFQTYRPLLFAIAYRMLGSASDAEDIVQETYLRYCATPASQIRSPKSYLSTIVTRLCLDELKSARVVREEYIGPWLPEPVLTGDSELTLLQTVEQRESISMAFLVLLERLTPHERAVLLLREVFGYGYQEIAEIVGTSTPSCRQLFHRAKERIAGGQPRFEASPEVQRRLVERFLAACQRGDLQALTEMLAHDVAAWSDGGGKVPAARRPVRGHDAIMRFALGLIRKAYADARFTFEEVNGAPALLTWAGDVLTSVIVCHVAGGQIQTACAVLNPDKLAYLQRQLRDRA
jgi:RNA polymerase sigma-70 factor (ECF subfamily)